MADIELIIKLNEEDYINIKNAVNSLIENGVERASMSKLCLAVIDGTLLPKGHGRLGDLDKILNKAMKYRESYMEAENSSYCRGKLHAYELYVEEVENAPTIIEADKAERSDKE